jgi:hypothetical protein
MNMDERCEDTALRGTPPRGSCSSPRAGSLCRCSSEAPCTASSFGAEQSWSRRTYTSSGSRRRRVWRARVLRQRGRQTHDGLASDKGARQGCNYCLAVWLCLWSVSMVPHAFTRFSYNCSCVFANGVRCPSKPASLSIAEGSYTVRICFLSFRNHQAK